MSMAGTPGAHRRGEPRVPFEGAVRLRYPLFQQFLKENAANISCGGMFIRTIQPGEPGAELDFEIRLEDDFTLLQGRGEVTWVRREPDGPDAPPGMGIRFIELTGDSHDPAAAATFVEVEQTGPDTAQVRFVQSYRSQRYNDLVRKRLLMVRDGGEWKIAAERVVQ